MLESQRGSKMLESQRASKWLESQRRSKRSESQQRGSKMFFISFLSKNFLKQFFVQKGSVSSEFRLLSVLSVKKFLPSRLKSTVLLILTLEIKTSTFRSTFSVDARSIPTFYGCFSKQWIWPILSKMVSYWLRISLKSTSSKYKWIIVEIFCTGGLDFEYRPFFAAGRQKSRTRAFEN